MLELCRDHSHWVQLVDAFASQDSGAVVPSLVFLCAGRSLHDVLKDGLPSAAQVRAVCLQTARALAHLHGRGFLHLDLKPANIMIEASDGGAIWRCRVCDLGAAAEVGGQATPVQHWLFWIGGGFRAASSGKPGADDQAGRPFEDPRAQSQVQCLLSVHLRSGLWAKRPPVQGPNACEVGYSLRHANVGQRWGPPIVFCLSRIRARHNLVSGSSPGSQHCERVPVAGPSRIRQKIVENGAF